VNAAKANESLEIQTANHALSRVSNYAQNHIYHKFWLLALKNRFSQCTHLLVNAIRSDGFKSVIASTLIL
jgi:hypothetical protein